VFRREKLKKEFIKEFSAVIKEQQDKLNISVDVPPVFIAEEAWLLLVSDAISFSGRRRV